MVVVKGRLGSKWIRRGATTKAETVDTPASVRRRRRRSPGTIRPFLTFVDMMIFIFILVDMDSFDYLQIKRTREI